jgi:acyl-CoA reductase-like NAD-dependent aldehyde dehydrogenase
MPRLEVLKTYKMYIGGQFPRTESARYYALADKKGNTIANICLGSRKDFRNAVEAARKAFGEWSGKTAYNRSQVIYRIAEMMEGRKSQFVDELVLQGLTPAKAATEVSQAIDLIVYYAGWADKYQQIYSSVNPVASKHFNFSFPEPTGVVSIIGPETPSLLGLVDAVIPCITGGNSCIVLASETQPLGAVTFAEVLATSDLPGGVINIITGTRKELLAQFASHMDVNAIIYCGTDKAEIKAVQENATLNVKRAIIRGGIGTPGPELINDTLETKTTWHPVGY